MDDQRQAHPRMPPATGQGTWPHLSGRWEWAWRLPGFPGGRVRASWLVAYRKVSGDRKDSPGPASLSPAPSSATHLLGQFPNRHTNSVRSDAVPRTVRTKPLHDQGAVWPSDSLDLPGQPQMHFSP